MRKFISAKLRRKILVGYGLVLALIGIVCLWAVVNLYQLGQASEAILQENYRSIQAAEKMINALDRQDSALLLTLSGNAAVGAQQFHQNEVEFLLWLSRAKDNITLAGEAETLQAVEEAYLDYLTVSAEPPQGRVAADPDHYHQAILPQFNRVRAACIELRDLNQAAMLRASERAQRVSVQAIGSMTGLGIVLAGLGLGLSLLFSKILIRPLEEMTQAAGQIAEGNYDVTITVRSNDEVGRLAKEIMAMSHKLKAFHELNVSRVLTEKRRGEAIIRSITDGLIVVDAAVRIIAINPVAARIWKTSPEQAVGKYLFDVVKNQNLHGYMRATAETGQPPQLDEDGAILAISNGEQQAYYHFSITPVKTEQDQMLGVVLLLQDVTKLKELDRLKSDFVMTASHELRTPLTGIAMSIGLLMERATAKLSVSEQELLQAAQEDVVRLRALVNNLLDLSKIESGRMEMDFETVCVSLLANQAMAALTSQAEEKGVVLSQQMPEDLPQVKADPNKITWVLTNLVANALRYTDQGGHIRVSAARAGDFVHLSVSDDGLGIPLEYQAKIFDKFVQVRDHRNVGGTGLGLAISKEIIKAHGGTIWVDSLPKQGSTFTFTLPTIANQAFIFKGETNYDPSGHPGC